MATNTAGGEGRELGFQAVHYMRRTVNWNTTGIRTANTVKLGTLPAGAQILQNMRVTKVAFDGTGPTLSVGTDSDNNNIDVGGEEATTSAVISTVATFLSFTQDTDVYILLDESTTTPSTEGQAVIVLSFVPDNDIQD
jgi:hypothetical protein